MRSLVVATFAFLLAWSAQAADGLDPRTPVLWEAPCLQRVDRSLAPVLHLPYGIPHEDTEVSSHEVVGSRAHQFFAFCRPTHPRQSLPNWITWTDVDLAKDANLVTSVKNEDVLEANDEWADCWSRVTDDVDRRPITFAMAEEGVDWDTTDVAPGVYTIHGYTFHPRFNLWSLRPGVVKVHDGEAAAVGPAVAIVSEGATLTQGEPYVLEGCVDALPGSLLSIDLADATKPGEPTWVRVLEDRAAEETFAIELGTDTLARTTSMVRLEVRDEMDRTFIGYMNGFLIVLEGGADPCDPAVDSECEPSGETGGDAPSGGDDPNGGSTGGDSPPTAGTERPEPEGDHAGDGGCTCATSRRSSASGRLWFMLLGLSVRRRAETN
jgi:hypothetical protein